MKFFLMCSFLLFSCFATAESLIRIDCQADTDGAKVFVDGQYQFDCVAYENFPVPLSAGIHQIRAVKSLGAEFEEVFTTTVELQAGVPQRLRLELPEKTLTEYGREQQRLREIEEQRLAREAATRAEEQRIAQQERDKQRKATEAKAALEALKLKAASGDIASMRALSSRYRRGRGVEQNSLLAGRWKRKAEERAVEIQVARLEADKSKYFEMTQMGLSEWKDSFEQGPLYGSMRIIDLGIGIPLFSSPLDITMLPTVPFRNADIDADIRELQRSAAAVIWARPDSLISRALIQD